MLALKKLVNPSGYIIFEVPDCTEGFEKFDYTTIWEEHILYFTDLTFKNCLNSGGFLLHYFEKYNYSFESVLIGIVKPDDNKNTFKNFNIEKNILDREIVRTQNFTKQLVKKHDTLKKFLKDPSAVKHYPALGEATISGLMVKADNETGLAKEVEAIVFGGSLQSTI